jgi:hypothetical protein
MPPDSVPTCVQAIRMIRMFSRTRLLSAALIAGLALVGSLSVSAQQDDSHRGRKYKVPPPSSRIEVTVVRAVNGKPIEAAAVIFHPMEGEHDRGAMELKTNEDGKAIIDVIPIGDVVRLQVIAKGFQTYGQDYKIDKPQMAMEIRLKRPGEQYSIYKQRGEAGNNGSDANKPSGNGSQAAPNDKSGSPDSKDQPNKQSNPDQSQPK